MYKRQPLDTVTRLTAYCADQAAFDGYVAKARELLERMDGIFDRYAAEGTVRRVNESAGKGPVPAEPELVEAIEDCRCLYEKTPGMNIALGSVCLLYTSRCV